ncbi:hypothetical protein [Brachybacterium sacelli]
MASLVALPLTACGNETGGGPSEAVTHDPSTSQDPADAAPQERIQGYFDAFDTAAAEGWLETSYNTEYLTPELAEQADTVDAQNRDSGATFEGERELSEWTVREQDEATVVVEFCQDTSNQRVMRDGHDQGEAEGRDVGRFTLTRDSTDEPWLIAAKEFHPEGTTCADHFGD